MAQYSTPIEITEPMDIDEEWIGRYINYLPMDVDQPEAQSNKAADASSNKIAATPFWYDSKPADNTFVAHHYLNFFQEWMTPFSRYTWSRIHQLHLGKAFPSAQTEWEDLNQLATGFVTDWLMDLNVAFDEIDWTLWSLLVDYRIKELSNMRYGIQYRNWIQKSGIEYNDDQWWEDRRPEDNPNCSNGASNNLNHQGTHHRLPTVGRDPSLPYSSYTSAPSLLSRIGPRAGSLPSTPVKNIVQSSNIGEAQRGELSVESHLSAPTSQINAQKENNGSKSSPSSSSAHLEPRQVNFTPLLERWKNTPPELLNCYCAIITSNSSARYCPLNTDPTDNGKGLIYVDPYGPSIANESAFKLPRSPPLPDASLCSTSQKPIAQATPPSFSSGPSSHFVQSSNACTPILIPQLPPTSHDTPSQRSHLSQSLLFNNPPPSISSSHNSPAPGIPSSIAPSSHSAQANDISKPILIPQLPSTLQNTHSQLHEPSRSVPSNCIPPSIRASHNNHLTPDTLQLTQAIPSISRLRRSEYNPHSTSSPSLPTLPTLWTPNLQQPVPFVTSTSSYANTPNVLYQSSQPASSQRPSSVPVPITLPVSQASVPETIQPRSKPSQLPRAAPNVPQTAARPRIKETGVPINLHNRTQCLSATEETRSRASNPIKLQIWLSHDASPAIPVANKHVAACTRKRFKHTERGRAHEAMDASGRCRSPMRYGREYAEHPRSRHGLHKSTQNRCRAYHDDESSSWSSSDESDDGSHVHYSVFRSLTSRRHSPWSSHDDVPSDLADDYVQDDIFAIPRMIYRGVSRLLGILW